MLCKGEYLYRQRVIEFIVYVYAAKQGTSRHSDTAGSVRLVLRPHKLKCYANAVAFLALCGCDALLIVLFLYDYESS